MLSSQADRMQRLFCMLDCLASPWQGSWESSSLLEGPNEALAASDTSRTTLRALTEIFMISQFSLLLAAIPQAEILAKKR